jgi:hypothetical protein
MKRPKEKGSAPRANTARTSTATDSQSSNTAANERQVSGFTPDAVKAAYRHHRRAPTDEELEVARTLYKADLLRLTLAGKHMLKIDKAGLLIKAFNEAMAGGQL